MKLHIVLDVPDADPVTQDPQEVAENIIGEYTDWYAHNHFNPIAVGPVVAVAAEWQP